MKATMFSATIVAMLAAIVPSLVEAGDRTVIYRKSNWRSAYGYDGRLARISPPIMTIVTPDLSYPVARFTYNRLDDGYDYPFGYGEYAVYGKWARDTYGGPVVTRCRLVWLDGARARSLNRCD